MTVTDTTAPAVAPQPPVADPTVSPALLQDAGGYFRIVKGQRIPVNAPGIAILDGTAAATAYRTAETLDKAIADLKEQYEAQVKIVQDEIGEKRIAMLDGRKVVTWGWGTRKGVDRGIAEALMTPENYAVAETVTPYRSFEPAFRNKR